MRLLANEPSFNTDVLQTMLKEAFPGAQHHVVGEIDGGCGMGIVYGKRRWAERIQTMDEAPDAIKRLGLRKFLKV